MGKISLSLYWGINVRIIWAAMMVCEEDVCCEAHFLAFCSEFIVFSVFVWWYPDPSTFQCDIILMKIELYVFIQIKLDTKIWKFSWIINIPSFQLNSFKFNSHTIEVWKCHNICWFIWIDLQVVVCVWFVDCRTLYTHHRNKIHVIYVSANQK